MIADKEILTAIKEKFGSSISDSELTGDILTITVSSNIIIDLIGFLKNDPAMNFGFLTTLCGIHYPDRELPLGVIYHLHNLHENRRIRIKTFLPDKHPELPTVTPLFKAANWMERETFDFYGIIFIGHPNLKRILNVEYLDFFPMRKEIPLEDPSREDKDDRYFGR
jgi:NADH-quinone oxidoreductase subunit C